MKWQMMFRGVSKEGDIKEKVEKKFESLEKYLSSVRGDLKRGLVRLSRGERWGYRVKVDVKLPGKKVSVEGKDKELLSAIDVAYEKTARMVRKYYEKMRRGRD